MQYNTTATESPGQPLQKGQWNKRIAFIFVPKLKPLDIFEMNRIELMTKGLFA